MSPVLRTEITPLFIMGLNTFIFLMEHKFIQQGDWPSELPVNRDTTVPIKAQCQANTIILIFLPMKRITCTPFQN